MSGFSRTSPQRHRQGDSCEGDIAKCAHAETRNVHVQHAEGEAKFWIDPRVQLHANYGLKQKRLAEAQKLVEEHLNEIRNAWAKHFPG